MYDFVVKTIGVDNTTTAMFFSTKKEARTAYDSMFAALMPSMTDFIKSIDYSDNEEEGSELEINYKDGSKSSVRLISTSDYIYEAVTAEIDRMYENRVSRHDVEEDRRIYVNEILTAMRKEIIAKDLVITESFKNEVIEAFLDEFAFYED